MGRNSKEKRDSGKPYTKEEVACLKQYIEEKGDFSTYEDGVAYAPYHKEKTGMERSGHALYMFFWRFKEGLYRELLNN